MTDVTDLGAVRADRDSRPSAWSPAEMLRHIARQIEAGEIAPEHVIVALAHNEADGGSVCAYRQAGGFGPFAALGVLDRIMAQMREPT